ncbi:hypothetical protein [Pseudonocardia sp. KRD291]|uniref:hypothetical protein n=1 Tax=Pseudonocardia sp. KRD291 TaxID=2792007 RepID=UPI001C49CDF9|nr:hypothetical protein [Pseudonocardia sp. KRD291]MBW0106439.1 hypothetical protein [Pseudonocardia sp. KRD291]
MLPRDALVGVAVGAVFGVAWVFWGSGGLAGPVPLVVRVVAVVVAVALLARAVMLLRNAPPGAGAAGAGSMFASRPYRLIVLAEIVAFFAGNAALQALGLAQYVICWTAVVVGVHFLGFGRVFQRLFYTVGAVILGIGVVGALVGLFGGSAVAVAAVTGLGCGAYFLAGSSATLLRGGRTA